MICRFTAELANLGRAELELDVDRFLLALPGLGQVLIGLYPQHGLDRTPKLSTANGELVVHWSAVEAILTPFAVADLGIRIARRMADRLGVAPTQKRGEGNRATWTIWRRAV